MEINLDCLEMKEEREGARDGGGGGGGGGGEGGGGGLRVPLILLKTNPRPADSVAAVCQRRS